MSDGTPARHLGWICFGCRRGGSIYDLAALLDRGPGGRRGALRGEEFKRVKRHVQQALGLEPSTTGEGAKRGRIGPIGNETSRR